MRKTGRQIIGQVGVITVDDQAVFRNAAHDVVEATHGFEPLAEVASGREVLELLDEVAADLVLVDVRMPDMNGIETTRRIKAAHPGVVVVLISIESRTNMPSNLEKTGAAAFVRKEDFKPSLLRELWEEHGHPGP